MMILVSQQSLSLSRGNVPSIRGLLPDLYLRTYSDAVDGYGITECGSLACLSSPCRNGARCVEVQANAGEAEAEESNHNNAIGLAAGGAGKRKRNGRSGDRRGSTGPSESSSRWSSSSPQETRNRNYGVIPKGAAAAAADDEGHSIMLTDYRTRTSRWDGAAAAADNDDYLMMEEDELAQDNRNWQCKCPTGYIGPTCEISVCDNNPCQYGGTCIPYPGSGYLCLCPFGKHGHYCEHSEY